MTNYRRSRVAGGTYFFTLNLWNRDSTLLVDKVDVLRAAVREVKTGAPFHIDAWVVLPDHLHCLWTLPDGDVDYSQRWRKIKAVFSRNLPRGEDWSVSRDRKGERGIWQRRFWEHTIRDERDYRAHMDYIHFNPVRHGLVEDVAAWPYSSFRRAVEKGVYPVSWIEGGEGPEDAAKRLGAFGER